MICERCKCETNMSTGSYFNTQQTSGNVPIPITNVPAQSN